MLQTSSCFLKPLNPHKLHTDEKNNWLVVAEKSSFSCFGSVGLQPSSVAADGSPLLGSIFTNFIALCCRCRCFRRFEVVLLAVERVLVASGHNLHLTFRFDFAYDKLETVGMSPAVKSSSFHLQLHFPQVR